MAQVYFVRTFKNIPNKYSVVFYPWIKGGPSAGCYKRISGVLFLGDALEMAASLNRGVWI